jgi:transposase
VQRIYEVIRPVVLFGMSPAERAAQTGAAERTVYRQVQRFTEGGMANLVPTASAAPPPRLPDALRTYIVAWKAEHPPLYLREPQTLCYVRFGRRPSRQTIKRVLAEAAPRAVERRYPRFHHMDPTSRRIAIIRLHAEGWTTRSIAAYLATSRPTVSATLKRWIDERFRGLPNKSSAPKQPARKVTFAALKAGGVRRTARLVHARHPAAICRSRALPRYQCSHSWNVDGHACGDLGDLGRTAVKVRT